MADKDKKKKEDLTNAQVEIVLDPSYNEIKEAVLTPMQRRKRAMTMRRYKGKITAARKRMANRKATPERLKARAKRAAINAMKKKLAGGRSYKDMSTGEKMMIDKRLKGRKAAIDRMARKMLPKVRQADIEKFRQKASDTRESWIDANLNKLFEEVQNSKR